ncbi:hypothetical protein ACFVJS_04135 [Nocardioides sp. NPDC057772]|uniref:hypothetical protein n=1 Tax=Nocardioides sp. NPDC057772 TaxID=3346245 RepID=UPI00366C2527
MSERSGNVLLKAARQHAGFGSQQALADALTRVAPQLGLGHVEISVRQVRRWESAAPPWPRSDYQRLLTHVLNLPIEQLGFTAPWDTAPSAPSTSESPQKREPIRRPPRSTTLVAGSQPATIAADVTAIMAAYRRMYPTVAPGHLLAVLVEHNHMVAGLVEEATGTIRERLALSLAESLLLAGRIEFFSLQRPADADATYINALQMAAVADDSLLGSAILAHTAFIPGWVKDTDLTANRIRAARVYARRAPASVEHLAWLDAVEAECATIAGNYDQALKLIHHSEDLMAEPNEHQPPDWFTWFSPMRLAAFKGNTELKAGRIVQARTTLQWALDSATTGDEKQSPVILGDLAAVEAAAGDPEAACGYAEQALDSLAVNWYATGMERIMTVRKALDAHADLDCVRRLDDRLYGWHNTLSALRH